MPGWWDDGCMMHMRKTYMQNRVVCYAVSCKLYIYIYIPFLKMKKINMENCFIFCLVYMYIFIAQILFILYSSGTILFMDGVVVLKTKSEFK